MRPSLAGRALAVLAGCALLQAGAALAAASIASAASAEFTRGAEG